MYSFIEGKLAETNPAYVVVETGGIGYFLNISLQTYTLIKGHDRYKLFTHLVVREDAMMLFGFALEAERTLFRHLISVSGVGAGTARMILSSLTTDEVFLAISHGKADVLQSVKGIGAKSAQRIIIDLRDKLGKEMIAKDILDISHNTHKNEALSGLTMLGFNKSLADKTLEKIISSDPAGANLTVEQLIKSALKIL
jgi:Holliday junction DNA helicase RuvA